MVVSLCKVRLCSFYCRKHGSKSVSSVGEKSNPEAVGAKLKMWDFPPKKCPIVCCFYFSMCEIVCLFSCDFCVLVETVKHSVPLISCSVVQHYVCETQRDIIMDASVVLLRFSGCRLHSNGQKCVYSCFSRETRMDEEMVDLVVEFTAYFTDSCCHHFPSDSQMYLDQKRHVRSSLHGPQTVSASRGSFFPSMVEYLINQSAMDQF